MSKRLTGVSIGGKSFFFNVNKAKNGVSYLVIVARRGQDKSTDEKMTLFDSQIPSFIHKMLEAYAEVCMDNGVPLWCAVPKPARPGSDVPEEALDSQSPEGKGALDDVPTCPECGHPPLSTNPDLPAGLIITWSPENKTHVRIHCGFCGWRPEGGEETQYGATAFRFSSDEARYWQKWAS